MLPYFWSERHKLQIKKISLGQVKKYRVKDGLASYLLGVKSMLGLGQGPTLHSTKHVLSSLHLLHSHELTLNPVDII